MELDKLIEELNEISELTEDWDTQLAINITGKIRKCTEVIKLLRECVNKENSEKWHWMIDDIGDFNNGAEGA